jgi:RecQ family ATP-dependent DNA helicase
MTDQVTQLRKKGVDVAFFNSDQNAESSKETRARLTRSGHKPPLLYVSPEKLEKNYDFRNILQRLHSNKEIARFVIDEAHCISTWGRDFRDSVCPFFLKIKITRTQIAPFQYKSLGSLRRDFPGVPIMALTATANEAVMNDVIEQLSIKTCTLLTQSFNRPNLYYEVRPKSKNLLNAIADIIHMYKGQSGIIYCLSRNKCEQVAKELRDCHKIKARHYHAQMTVEDKNRAQAAWQKGECQVIVATVSFRTC